MKNIQNFFLYIVLVFLLSACAPSVSVLYAVGIISQTPVPPTETNTPTFTLIPPTASPTNTPSPTFSPSPTITSTSTPTATATQKIFPTVNINEGVSNSCSATLNTDYENQIISLINQERANNGLSKLSFSNAISRAARGHSLDMACHNFASHTGSNGSSVFTRLVQAGFSYSYAAENVAGGYGSPSEVVSGWMNSSGHRTNILDPNMTYIGVGYASLSGTTYGDYWTADFGRP